MSAIKLDAVAPVALSVSPHTLAWGRGFLHVFSHMGSGGFTPEAQLPARERRTGGRAAPARQGGRGTRSKALGLETWGTVGWAL